jgi:hypothetical protein
MAGDLFIIEPNGFQCLEIFLEIYETSPLMADVYDVIVLRGPEYWTKNWPVFVFGLHTQEKAEDESETPVYTPVMWLLFAVVNMFLTLEGLTACMLVFLMKQEGIPLLTFLLNNKRGCINKRKEKKLAANLYYKAKIAFQELYYFLTYG